MNRISIAIGGLLIALGLVGYFGTGTKSVTALIPAFFGLPIAVLGLVALSQSESVRKHAMHAAAVLGLLGFLACAGRAIPKFASGAEFDAALTSITTMMIVCGVFVALCVQSFIAVRRARKAAESAGQ